VNTAAAPCALVDHAVDELIRKPGPPSSHERALMETHTIEGQEMLEKVGGLLGEVGRVVRSCHERYDGKGYPDGLAGDDIPLVARIVAGLRRLQRDDNGP
jgi:HD-GYP domain-containing protein (c-di-GMP phosphodiesterase class II)